MGLVLTQPISPTPWTRPQNPLGANSSLTIRLLKKHVQKYLVKGSNPAPGVLKQDNLPDDIVRYATRSVKQVREY